MPSIRINGSCRCSLHSLVAPSMCRRRPMPTSRHWAIICSSSSIRMASRLWRRSCNCSEQAMVWYVWLASLLLLWASQATAHELNLLDDRRPTPGLRLELTELPATTTASSAIPRYRLRTSGLPRGVVFGVWTRDFGHAFHEVATGFQMDSSGVMVSNELDGASWILGWWRWLVKSQPRRLDEMALPPRLDYPRG